MVFRLRPFIGVLAIIATTLIGSRAAGADPTEHRVALVIGNSAYQAGALKLPANDAGLMAQTLQAAGFDVVGARDLDGDTLRHTFRDFLDKVSGSGPDTVVFVYLAGYGVQYAGENYFVPVDATLARDIDVPIQAVRLSDYTRPLSTMPLKARFIVIDGARENPFVKSGNPLASGLAMVKPEPGVLVGFNAAPGTVAPESSASYGPYAQALAEMIREGGLGPAEVFDRVRQRVNSATSGAFVPWSTARIDTPFVFFERAADAPAPAVSRADIERRRARALREMEADDAYHEALDRDTLEAYLDFLDAYPHHRLAKRVRVIVAARREAIIWRRTYDRDTPEAYWSYLDRYPDGPHAWDARRRLRDLAAELDAPPTFVHIDYDVPPPPPDEFVFIHRPFVYFSDPYYDFDPPPPPPVYYVPPPPPDFIDLVAPEVFVDAYVLPVPVFVPVPRWCDPPRYVAPPPNNVVFANIHNTTIVNNVTNITNVTSVNTAPGAPPAVASPVPGAAGPAGGPPLPGGPVPAGLPAGGPPPAGSPVVGPGPATLPKVGGLTAGQIGAGAAAAGVTAAALKVALPPSVAQKAATTPNTPSGAPKPVTATTPLLTPNGTPVPQLSPKPPSSSPITGPANAPGTATVPPGPAKGSATPAATSAGIPPAPAAAPGVSAPMSSGSNSGLTAPAVQSAPGTPPTPKNVGTAAPPASLSPGAPTPPPSESPPSLTPPAMRSAPSRAGSAPPPDAAGPVNSGPQRQHMAPRAPDQSPAPAGQPSTDHAPRSVGPAPSGPSPAQVQEQNSRAAIEAEKRAAQQRAMATERENARRAQEQQQRAAEAQRRTEQQQRAAEAQRRAEQQQRAAEAQHRAEQQQRAGEAQRRAEQQQRAAEAQHKAEQQRAAEAQRRAEQQRAAEMQRQNAIRAQQQARQSQPPPQQRHNDQKNCGVLNTPPCPH